MPLKEISVAEKEDEIVVEFWPGMYTTPTYEREPTEKNPKIKADLGIVGNKLSPIRSYYPKDTFDVDDIVEFADSVDNDDSLFSKIEHCPMCERKRREIINRIREAIRRGKSDEERRKNMIVETEKIRDELRSEGYIKDRGGEELEEAEREEEEAAEEEEYEPKEEPDRGQALMFMPTIPIVPEFPMHYRAQRGQESAEEEEEAMPTSELLPMQNDITNNLNHAISDIYKTALIIINTPSQIRLPFSD